VGVCFIRLRSCWTFGELSFCSSQVLVVLDFCFYFRFGSLACVFDFNGKSWFRFIKCYVVRGLCFKRNNVEKATMTIVIEPDIIELPAEDEQEIDPDDLEYEDPPALPARPNWDV